MPQSQNPDLGRHLGPRSRSATAGLAYGRWQRTSRHGVAPACPPSRNENVDPIKLYLGAITIVNGGLRLLRGEVLPRIRGRLAQH